MDILGRGITKTRPCNIQQFFYGCKNDIIHMKNCGIFLKVKRGFKGVYIFSYSFAQHIDCGYTLEPSQ